MAGVTPRSATEPLWWDTAAAPSSTGATPASAALPQLSDVVVVGGGYTGLWTAYYLLRARPALDVLVLEAEHVGFGASGRNGGWVSALWPVSADTIARRTGRTAALAQLAALRDTVDEVGRVDAEEAAGQRVRQGRGAARRPDPRPGAARAGGCRARHLRGAGHRLARRRESRERLDLAGTRGATFTPHCARVHPRRLVDGLAAAVRRLGGRVVEGARVTRASDGVVVLEDGHRVSARTTVLATEGWTGSLPGLARRVVPVYSLMVATEPLSEEQWGRVGLAAREVFADHGHVVIYGQRTDDGRLAFGGRGAPYHWGSAVRPEFDHEERVFAALRATLRALLPQLGDIRFTHAWGGPLGIARDWHPSVSWDPVSRTGWAGGYVGDGVAASNLAGRTLADLALGRSSPLTELPWVGHRSPRWEPEPLRWIGVNAGLRLARLADREELATGAPARLGPLLARLTAH